MIIPYESQSSGNTYMIDTDTHTCSCPAFVFGRNRGEPCKHIKDLTEKGVFIALAPHSKIVELPEPHTIICKVCARPLRSIIEVPSRMHGRCSIRL